MDYIISKEHRVIVDNELIVSNHEVVDAVLFANEALQKLGDTAKQFDINIFEALGMRNLSGIVGEYLVKSFERRTGGKLQSNPHQAGYPDLLLTNTEDRKAYFESLCTVENGKRYIHDKVSFSPYRFGGLEIKATCGNTPVATKIPKPLIGEQRIELLESFEWKAHHRLTNNLIGIFWDFINSVPTIVAVFFSNKLDQDDWGKIVQPHSNGGRTTSVSIMNSKGVKKMCDGWIAIIDDNKYVAKFAQKKWIGYNIKSI